MSVRRMLMGEKCGDDGLRAMPTSGINVQASTSLPEKETGWKLQNQLRKSSLPSLKKLINGKSAVWYLNKNK